LKVRQAVATSILDLTSDRAPEGAAADDLRLIEGLRTGAGWAYEALTRIFQQPVYALATRLLDDPSEASDVVQEVFLKVFRNIGSFRGKSTLRTWIYRITVNEAHNSRRWFFRHRRREVELDADPEESRNWKEIIPDNSRTPYDVVLDAEQRAVIEAALGRISPIFREAVVLRDITDLSYEEIAAVLAVSLGTVKSRILRGREALREELAGSLNPRPALRLMPETAEKMS
jgi:RNA polymerase sigma-70 factor (ECF subfamily)